MFWYNRYFLSTHFCCSLIVMTSSHLTAAFNTYCFPGKAFFFHTWQGTLQKLKSNSTSPFCCCQPRSVIWNMFVLSPLVSLQLNTNLKLCFQFRIKILKVHLSLKDRGIGKIFRKFLSIFISWAAIFNYDTLISHIINHLPNIV